MAIGMRTITKKDLVTWLDFNICQRHEREVSLDVRAPPPVSVLVKQSCRIRNDLQICIIERLVLFFDFVVHLFDFVHFFVVYLVFGVVLVRLVLVGPIAQTP